jgi:hypothetical protein
MPNTNRLDRRQFAERLTAFSAAAVLVAPSLSSVAEDKPSAEPQDKNPKDAPDTSVPQKVPEPSQEVLLLKYLTMRYPSDQFDESALKGIYGDLRGDQARGRILSEFPLKNSDEPCFVFRAYRATP